MGAKGCMPNPWGFQWASGCEVLLDPCGGWCWDPPEIYLSTFHLTQAFREEWSLMRDFGQLLSLSPVCSPLKWA